MDIFSLGCVIAELFMERPLFDFAKLLAYRDNKYDPYNDLVNEIKNDKPLLDMILSMLSLDPGQRKSANEYLQEQNDRSFPSYFVYLKNYIKGIAIRRDFYSTLTKITSISCLSSSFGLFIHDI